MTDAATLSFHFSLGVVAFFSPCGFPMLPAYLAYYLQAEADEARPLRATLLRGIGAGSLAAAGAFGLLLAIGGLAVALGAPFKERVSDLELVGGLIVLTLGVLTLMGRGPSFKVGLSPSKTRSALSLVGFGALYAGVAASCVAPLLIYVMFAAAAAPTLAEGFLLVGAYAAGMAVLLLVVTLLVATARNAVVARMRAALPYIERVAGGILVLVGFYLVWYWAGLKYGFYVPQFPQPSLP